MIVRAAVVIVTFTAPADAADATRPNFVIVYADDLGYADIGCFGAKDIATPHLDRMAQEGCRLTSFYVAQAVCSASRTALLTGCYPNRVGILGALGPQSKIGIHENEWTIAEVLKQRGYATGIFGKWHLGHHPQFLPTQNGFDEYFGLPYSNDMWPRHPTSKFPDLPLMEAERILEYNPDQTQLTTWYAQRAVQFIETHQSKPFFLYVPHAMPHVPLFVSDKFAGRFPRGLFADVIAEIDWSVGEILATLKRCNIDDNTLVIFTSDNGPWLSYGNHAGSAGPLREGKGTAWEGGVREPFVARWPGKIPAGHVSSEPVGTIDLLPTLAKLAGAALPPHKIDGLDIWPVLSGAPNAKTPHEAYWYYWGQELHAIRSGDWKLHFPHKYRAIDRPGKDGQPGPYREATTELALFNLASDIGEQTDVAAKHPEVVARLKTLADQARQELGDTLTGVQGTGARPAGRLEP
ncbi:MAG TPA: sulfatase [Planctomycetaceae bacterium]|nr:sulfatase [Planctomycetaceae bacterium]